MTCQGNAIKSIHKNAFDYGHIFSDYHMKEGILNLGKSHEEIVQKFSQYILQADELKLLKEGTNQLHVLINSNKVTIRCHIEKGELLKINGYIGKTRRALGTIIKFE